VHASHAKLTGDKIFTAWQSLTIETNKALCLHVPALFGFSPKGLNSVGTCKQSKQGKEKGPQIMFTTLIHVFDYSLGNHYAIAQHEDKETAIAETVSRADEIFTQEFLDAKKPYKVSIIYPSGKRRIRWINKA
jgi:hypothetical protein